MYAVKIEITQQDFDRLITERLSEDDISKFPDCEWVPVVIKTTDCLNIEIIAVPSPCSAKINEASYTAFLYEANGVIAEDMATYDTKVEAVAFAKFRNWDEVVNDVTGEIVWRR